MTLNYTGEQGTDNFKPNKELEDILKVLSFRWFQLSNAPDGRRGQVMNCKRGEPIPDGFAAKRADVLSRPSRMPEKPEENSDEDSD